MTNEKSYVTMMTEIRDALDEGRFAEYKKRKLEGMANDGSLCEIKKQ